MKPVDTQLHRGAFTPEPTIDEYGTWICWYWFDLFLFTVHQRPVMLEFWKRRANRTHYLASAAILRLAGSSGGSARDVFKNSPAWGTLIVYGPEMGGPAGTYRLTDRPLIGLTRGKIPKRITRQRSYPKVRAPSGGETRSYFEMRMEQMGLEE